jgi:uncharacterized membrane protein
MRSVVDFLAVMLTALVAGTTFGILFGYDPAGISGPAYIEVQQGAIRGLNLLIPALAGGAILFTLIAAWLSRDTPGRALLLILAACVLIGGGAITRFYNQPINAIVIHWDAHNPPAQWEVLRDHWWYWHVIRTWVAIAGLALLVIATRMRVGRD